MAALFMAGCTTTQPLSYEELAEQAQRNMEQLFSQQQAQPSPLTLDKALLRALEKNLELRTKRLEAAIASGDKALANYAMLPKLTAQAGYQDRSNVLGSVSESVETGQQSLEASTSTEQSYSTHSLALSWNILDFGLARLRSKDAHDQTLIKRQELRRARQMVVRDLLYAWDKATLYQRLSPEIARVRDLAEQALEKSKSVEAAKLRNPALILDYRKSLLLMVKRLNRLSMEASQARDELARMLQLPAGQPLELAANGGTSELDLPSAPLEYWQWLGLTQRAEIREAAYASRIAERTKDASFWQTLPSMLLRYGHYENDNRFLVNGAWQEAGAQLSWDLIQLANYPARNRRAQMQSRLAEVQEKLQVMAVMAQVSIAANALGKEADNACISEQLTEVDDKRLRYLDARYQGKAVGRMALIKNQVENLLLKIEKGLDDASERQARLRLLVSSGVDLLPPNIDLSDGAMAAADIRHWVKKGLTSSVQKALKRANQSLTLESDTIVPMKARFCS